VKSIGVNPNPHDSGREPPPPSDARGLVVVVVSPPLSGKFFQEGDEGLESGVDGARVAT